MRVVHEGGGRVGVLHLAPGQHCNVLVRPAPPRPLRALQAGGRAGEQAGSRGLSG